jgi:alpha-mannosidase
MQTAKHDGSLAPQHSFLQTSGDNVIVTALKKAEDGNDLVLRFYEWAGQEKDVQFTLPANAVSASETNLMEVPISSPPTHDGTIVVHTKPFEIKTVKVQFGGTNVADGHISETNK